MARTYEDCQLRPLAEADKDRVLAWRNQERVRINMYTDHVISADEHAAWFREALKSQTAKHFIFEYQAKPVGFVSFTKISQRHRTCVWAFYLGEANLPKGSGAAMEFLALEQAFEHLGIRKLQCEVFVFNAAVIKLHERFGFKREALFEQQYEKHGKYEDVAALAMFDKDWAATKDQLFKVCFSS